MKTHYQYQRRRQYQSKGVLMRICGQKVTIIQVN